MNLQKKTPILALAVSLAAGLCLVGSPPVAAADDAFGTIVDHYEPIRQSLLRTSLDTVGDQARQIERIATEARGLDAAGAGVPAEKLPVVEELVGKIRAAAARLAAARDVEAAREALGELSKPLARWHGLRGGEGTFAVAYCPMVKKSWLQPADEEIGNPYDSSMPRCGSFVGR